MSRQSVELPLTEHQRTRLSRLGIQEEKLSKLRVLWQEERLPDEAWPILVDSVTRLATFHHHERPQIRPISEQFKQLDAVAAAADALGEALERVGHFAIELDGHLSTHDVLPAPGVDEMFARITTVLRVTRATAAAASETIAGLEAAGITRKGRPLVLHRYANLLSGMAGKLAPFGVKLSTAGMMRRLGDAVFDAACVASTSDGALRFLTERQGAAHWKDGAFKPPT